MNDHQSLDHKTYATSAELATRFSYSKDYISRLAREGKVNARQVGRQWLIEENSLQSFVASVEMEKKQRAAELRRERQQERTEVNVDKALQLPMYTHALPSPIFIAGQVIALALCAVIVGSLGLRMAEESITLKNMNTVVARGVQSAYEGVVGQAAAVYTGAMTNDAAVHKKQPERTMMVASQFSDEVILTVSPQYGEVVTPVFATGTGATYRLDQIEPINTQSRYD